MSIHVEYCARCYHPVNSDDPETLTYEQQQQQISDLQQQLERECIASGVLCDELNATKAEAQRLREDIEGTAQIAEIEQSMKESAERALAEIYRYESQCNPRGVITHIQRIIDNALSNTEVSDKGEQK